MSTGDSIFLAPELSKNVSKLTIANYISKIVHERFYLRGNKEISFNEGQPKSHTLALGSEKTLRSEPQVPWQT